MQTAGGRFTPIFCAGILVITFQWPVNASQILKTEIRCTQIAIITAYGGEPAFAGGRITPILGAEISIITYNRLVYTARFRITPFLSAGIFIIAVQGLVDAPPLRITIIRCTQIAIITAYG